MQINFDFLDLPITKIFAFRQKFGVRQHIKTETHYHCDWCEKYLHFDKLYNHEIGFVCGKCKEEIKEDDEL